MARINKQKDEQDSQEISKRQLSIRPAAVMEAPSMIPVAAERSNEDEIELCE